MHSAVFGLCVRTNCGVLLELAVFQDSVLRILPYSQYFGFDTLEYSCTLSILGFDTLKYCLLEVFKDRVLLLLRVLAVFRHLVLLVRVLLGVFYSNAEVFRG